MPSHLPETQSSLFLRIPQALGVGVWGMFNIKYTVVNLTETPVKRTGIDIDKTFYM